MVIDHNDDLFHRCVEEFRTDLSVRVVASTGRKGLSGARNTGLGATTADIVVFLDDDAEARPDWLAGLLAPYADPRVVAVGGAAEPAFPPGHRRPALLPSAQPDESGVRGELDWVVGCTYTGQPARLADVRNLMGCNMSFRRDVFASVGGFSEDLGRVGTVPLGCEETELCLRVGIVMPDARIVFEPRATISHQVSEQRLTWEYLWRRCYAEGVSKAAVSSMIQRPAALETERAYVARVLPTAVLRQVRQAVGQPGRRIAGAQGAAAIVLALTATAAGFGIGAVALRTSGKVHTHKVPSRIGSASVSPVEVWERVP